MNFSLKNQTERYFNQNSIISVMIQPHYSLFPYIRSKTFGLLHHVKRNQVSKVKILELSILNVQIRSNPRIHWSCGRGGNRGLHNASEQFFLHLEYFFIFKDFFVLKLTILYLE